MNYTKGEKPFVKFAVGAIEGLEGEGEVFSRGGGGRWIIVRWLREGGSGGV